jgi:hypothetical protein
MNTLLSCSGCLLPCATEVSRRLSDFAIGPARFDRRALKQMTLFALP